MSSPRIILLLGGAGLGNATRAVAIAQAVEAQGLKVEAWAGPKHQNFLAATGAFTQLKILRATTYKKPTPLGYFSSIIRFLVDFLINQLTIYRELRGESAVLVLDSCYTFRGLWSGRIRVVAINSAYETLRQMPIAVWTSPRFWPQLFIEVADALFHCLPHIERLSPGLFGQGRGSIGLVVGREFFDALSLHRDRLQDLRTPSPIRIFVLRSGSALASPLEAMVTRLRSLPHVEVLDLAFAVQPPKELFAADLWLVNGGLSSIGEGIAAGKPMICAPVFNHAEQWTNASRLCERGWAVMAESLLKMSDDELLGALKKLASKSISNDHVPLHGSSLAAKAIVAARLSLLKSSEDPAVKTFPDNQGTRGFSL